MAADFDINVKVAHQDFSDPDEAIAIGDQVTSPNIGNTGDCMVMAFGARRRT